MCVLGEVIENVSLEELAVFSHARFYCHVSQGIMPDSRHKSFLNDTWHVLAVLLAN